LLFPHFFPSAWFWQRFLRVFVTLFSEGSRWPSLDCFLSFNHLPPHPHTDLSCLYGSDRTFTTDLFPNPDGFENHKNVPLFPGALPPPLGASPVLFFVFFPPHQFSVTHLLFPFLSLTSEVFGLPPPHSCIPPPLTTVTSTRWSPIFSSFLFLPFL